MFLHLTSACHAVRMPSSDLTRQLNAAQAGWSSAPGGLLDAIYPVLHGIAEARLRGQPDGHTLRATDLVHEAYLRIARYSDLTWESRGHFYGAAAQTMRRILVDHARKKSAAKRQGKHVAMTEAGGAIAESAEGILEINHALDRLAAERPRWVRVVECRYFAGLTIPETAEALGVAASTVSNDWMLARSWLHRELVA